ncbi:MAG: hypothetical protein M3Z29_10900, partial [Pseudomonadota bacterium]|nr:hypothetical protein [Pseudomonadota bacterium]
MHKSNSLPIVPAGASAPSPKPTAPTPQPTASAHPFAELLQQQKTLASAAPASGAGSRAAPASRSSTPSGTSDAAPTPPASTTVSHAD